MYFMHKATVVTVIAQIFTPSVSCWTANYSMTMV